MFYSMANIAAIMTASRKRELPSKLRIHRLKGSYYTMIMPIQKRRSARRERSTRSVYIVARPIKKAGSLSSLSEGKFSLCHWALLISPNNEKQLRSHIERQAASCSQSRQSSWGTLFEIFNIDGTIEVHVVEDFGRHISPDWGYACIMHLGETHLQDAKIVGRGEYILSAMWLNIAYEIRNLYPDYHGFSNNCQNFVQYLLKFVCPKLTEVAPLTIHESVQLVCNVVTLRSLPHTRLRKPAIEVITRMSSTARPFNCVHCAGILRSREIC